MIHLKNFSDALRTIIEANFSGEVHFVLTAGMIDTVKVSSNKLALVVMPRSKPVHIDKCDDNYSPTRLFLGIRIQPTNDDLFSRIDDLSEELRTIMQAIRDSGTVQYVSNSNVIIYDDIEGFSTKGFLYLSIDLNLKYFNT